MGEVLDFSGEGTVCACKQVGFIRSLLSEAMYLPWYTIFTSLIFLLQFITKMCAIPPENQCFDALIVSEWTSLELLTR